jgi:2-phosphosulfolactate phosphatase
LTVPFRDQSAFDIRCEWAPSGVAALSACRTFIVVDVLSFSTTVSIAVERGALVFPSGRADVRDLARQHGALVAGSRGDRLSLSPASWLDAAPGTRVVLPSPNGAVVSREAARRGHVLAGCLRNRTAVAARAAILGGPFAIIPAPSSTTPPRDRSAAPTRRG